jgi:Tc5 transposase DNA-binding domain
MPRNDTQRIASSTRERKLNDAIAGLKDGTFVHVRQASRATGVSKTTLFRHLNGGRSKREAQHHRQQLSLEEECTLAKWVQRLSSTGHPVHHSFLRELAEEIRKPRVADLMNPLPKLGKNWTSRFLARNPLLQSKIAKSIEAARKEVTEAQIEKWFNEFNRVVDEYNILPENTYNMDETGSGS